MGQITRLLNVTSGNASLPRLVIYDASEILQQLLDWPTLRAFFDFSDRTTMTESGGQVVSVTDLTGTYTATAASGERGTYGAAAMNGQPGLTLTGAQKYAVPALMGTGTRNTIASAFMSTATDNVSQMLFADASTPAQNFYAGGDNLLMYSAAVTLPVAGLRNRTVNGIWTMNVDTDAASIYCDGLTIAGTSTQPFISGDANIGAWHNASATNRWIGHLGYLAIFDEDASQNATLRNLLDEYALRRWRLA